MSELEPRQKIFGALTDFCNRLDTNMFTLQGVWTPDAPPMLWVSLFPYWREVFSTHEGEQSPLVLIGRFYEELAVLSVPPQLRAIEERYENRQLRDHNTVKAFESGHPAIAMSFGYNAGGPFAVLYAAEGFAPGEALQRVHTVLASSPVGL